MVWMALAYDLKGGILGLKVEVQFDVMFETSSDLVAPALVLGGVTAGGMRRRDCCFKELRLGRRLAHGRLVREC
jgi:hypothetical protein